MLCYTLRTPAAALHCLPVINAFHLHMIPSSEDELYNEYGNDVIRELAQHYHVDLTTAVIA